MTKEELEKESKENFEQYKLTDEDYVECDGEKILMFNYEYYAEDEYFRFYSNGYLAGAEPREKRIADLEAESNDLCDNLETQDLKIAELEKENTELKKNYEDSLVACGVLKAKVDTLAQPSPLESMQDALIATQKVANEKQKDQLTKAKEIIRALLKHTYGQNLKTQNDFDLYLGRIKEAEQFLKE